MRRKRRENNKNVEEEGNNKKEEKDEEEGWVSKTLSSVLKGASLPSHLLICTICAPRVIEPGLGKSQQKIIELT